MPTTSFFLFWLLLLSYKYTQFIQQVFLSLKAVCKQKCHLHYTCSSFVTLISCLHSANLNNGVFIALLWHSAMVCYLPWLCGGVLCRGKSYLFACGFSQITCSPGSLCQTALRGDKSSSRCVFPSALQCINEESPPRKSALFWVARRASTYVMPLHGKVFTNAARQTIMGRLRNFRQIRWCLFWAVSRYD